jgi:uncharacterized membrane protein
MAQSSEPPVARRLRVVRRRITVATLATFLAAWLAVAALGKGGSTSTAATSPSPTTGSSSQTDEGASSAQSSDGASGGSDWGSSDSGSSQSNSQAGPVTTSQS